jgi:hypothetical protein
VWSVLNLSGQMLLDMRSTKSRGIGGKPRSPGAQTASRRFCARELSLGQTCTRTTNATRVEDWLRARIACGGPFSIACLLVKLARDRNRTVKPDC